MGLCLFFLPNFPGATFIQGATIITDSILIRTNLFAHARQIWIPNPWSNWLKTVYVHVHYQATILEALSTALEK